MLRTSKTRTKARTVPTGSMTRPKVTEASSLRRKKESNCRKAARSEKTWLPFFILGGRQMLSPFFVRMYKKAGPYGPAVKWNLRTYAAGNPAPPVLSPQTLFSSVSENSLVRVWVCCQQLLFDYYLGVNSLVRVCLIVFIFTFQFSPHNERTKVKKSSQKKRSQLTKQ